MRAPTVVLLDVDGTLLSSGGAGRRAMEAAFTELFSRPGCGFDFSGMTDRAIARRSLAEIGAPSEDDAVSRVIEVYLGRLELEVTRSAARLCAGVAEALLALEGRAGLALGLGTGNVREGARLKIERVARFDRFAFGGFGCDHEDRAELLRIGAERGAARLGVERGECRVVVVGDTPRDVAAAKAIGAESVAVATGPFGVDALEACAPTYVFRDLLAAGATAAIAGG